MKQQDGMLSNTGVIKSVLLLLVIIGHSIAYWATDWFTGDSLAREKWAIICFQWLGSFHVYAFALVSGMIFAFKMEKRAYSSFGELLIKKMKRLLVPYLFVALVWVIPVSTVLLKWNTTYIFYNFVLCAGPSQLWFLWMLFDVFVIVWMLWGIISRNAIVGWIISLGLYFIGSMGMRHFLNYFCIWTACQYFIYFYLGIRLYRKSVLVRIPWYVLLIIDFIIFFIYINNYLTNELGILYSYGGAMFLHLIGSLMGWSTLNVIAENIKWREKFGKFAVLAMPIYLFHQQIIYISIRLFENRIFVLGHSILNLIMALLVSMMIGMLLSRYKITRFLIGEK